MQNLIMTLVQTSLHWQKPDMNRADIEEYFIDLKGKTDLIILPEMFTTGFTMAPEGLAEDESGATLEWMQQQSRLTGAAICGSLIINSPEGYRNRLYWVTPEGASEYYDKVHLFRMANEHEHYAAGDRRLIIAYRGWRIMPQICYDLRFPVWSRNRNDYDLLLYVANWPAARRHAWRTLLQARAIENQCYVAGVNRVGKDGNGVEYSGDSLLIDFKGELMIDRAPGEVFVETGELKYSVLADFREAFPAWMDADEFSVKGKVDKRSQL
ncbi:amidohydrolase [Nitrincola sp. MINF-07-Sa-05]|uniref:amidohydrolase n=1 Tax=Nitrincola salilacus TaxID=3400273 RepID=UPI003918635B